MDRAAWLLDGIDRDSQILEIGPSYSPIAPKAAGWRTHVVDHESRAGLRNKYAAAGVPIEAIEEVEEVDTIWRGAPLDQAVPPALLGGFDAIIASHVVEHLPDLIGFLGAAARLLRPAGVIALAVPDRRYCFDFFKPITLTGDLLEAHAARRSRHAPRTVWNQHAYSVHADGVGAWGRHRIGAIEFTDPFEQAAAAVEAGAGQRDEGAGPYQDCHAWHFTPAAFRLAVLELGQLGAIDWRIDRLEAPWGAEFLCLLRRGAERAASGRALQPRRMALLLDLLAEQRDQVDCVLGSAELPGPAGADARQGWGGLHMLRRTS